MELGGKSPQLVFADADIEAARRSSLNAIIQNGGQTCSAGSRVLIERSGLRRAFSAAIAERVRQGARRRRMTATATWAR